MTTLSEVKKETIRIKVIKSLPSCYEYGEDVFKSLPINRDLKRPHIMKLVKGFRLVHPHGVSVLTVIKTRAFNEDPTDLSVEPQLFVCDGHNRREAAYIFAKEIEEEVPLSFNIIEIVGEDTIQNVGKVLETINVNLGTWTPNNYKVFREKTGHEDYRTYSELKETMKKDCGISLGDSDMLQITGLGNYTMTDFKKGDFRITDLEKSQAILDVIGQIGLNSRRPLKEDGFPQTHIKRVLMKKLTSLDTVKIESSAYKFQAFLEHEHFSYDEVTFRAQLERILN